MRRRTLLKSFVTALMAGRLARLRALARGQVQELTASQLAAMGAIAEVVLPSSLGADGRDLVVEQFASWVRGYREGADMGHGYGSATLRRQSGPSPARNYPAQFDALDAAARARGGTSFASLPVDARRAIVETALNTPQRVTRLPSQPNGTNLIADFMGLYYSSPEAWDLAYERRIGRDRCRSLDGSEERPSAIVRGVR
ncbi:MAG TPA: gluconate 2-dehydrogenase subunit 3 family protein [Vicinamibacterales bacterium]|nr:gluconate 2-dehydrogenase subunit 3 family protein [Vicinamibacterales bacterium]